MFLYRMLPRKHPWLCRMFLDSTTLSDVAGYLEAVCLFVIALVARREKGLVWFFFPVNLRALILDKICQSELEKDISMKSEDSLSVVELAPATRNEKLNVERL